MNDYVAHANQTLMDVTVHAYGSIDVLLSLTLLNNLSITDDLNAGQVLQLIEAPINLLVKKSVESRGIIPATSVTDGDLEFLNPILGIGTMVIESTFIIS